MSKSINIHLYPSNFLHESRIEKIVEVIESLSIFNSIWLLGVYEPGLERKKCLSDSITLHRLGRSTIRRSLFLKSIAFFHYYFKIILLLRGKNISCINAHSLSVLPLAVALKYWKKSVLIYDTHELETETHSLNGFRKSFARLVERSLIDQPDQIFCVSEEISTWYATRYKREKPITILNSPPLEPLGKSTFLREKFQLRLEQKIAVYLGVIESGRGIEELVHAFEKRSDDSVIVVFVGYGSLVSHLKTTPAYGRTVFFHSAVPRNQITHIASSADIGLCLVSPTCLSYSYCMPNKLFEYLMSGLPVAVSPCVSLKKFVEHHRVGFTVDEMNTEALIRAINLIVTSDLKDMKLRSRETAVAYSWETQATLLRSEYQKLFKKG